MNSIEGIGNAAIYGVDVKINYDNAPFLIEINGVNLFKLHCRQCHAPPDIYPDHNVAHALRGLFDRLPKGEYFTVFLQDSYSLKKSGDAYANKLDAEINSDYEHKFKAVLSDKEISDIAEYIKLESRTPQ